MTILFSPSEAKTKGGEKRDFNENSFIFPHLFEKRMEVLHLYNDYIKKASKEELKKLFGIKEDEKIEYYKEDIFKKPIKKAIERYSGVAFKYLNYSSLSQTAKDYIDNNTIIFSNLFGPVKAGDFGIIDYKLKQGEKIGDFAVEKFYKTHFSKALDEYLEANLPIVDLRAGFYEKFYKIKLNYLTMKFVKNGKVVSHFAKAYRGEVLREMAKTGAKNEEEIKELEIKNLYIKEIVKIKNKTEIIYEIRE